MGGLGGELRAATKALWKAWVFGDVGVEGTQGAEEIEWEGHTSGNDGAAGVREEPGTCLLRF